jgi:hypothetical protein
MQSNTSGLKDGNVGNKGAGNWHTNIGAFGTTEKRFSKNMNPKE